MKKQGVLPLTFKNPKDYDKIASTDRISFLNLADQLNSGSNSFTAKVTKEDGSSFELPLNHTMNSGQIKWFKAGSALNLMGSK